MKSHSRQAIPTVIIFPSVTSRGQGKRPFNTGCVTGNTEKLTPDGTLLKNVDGPEWTEELLHDILRRRTGGPVWAPFQSVRELAGTGGPKTSAHSMYSWGLPVPIMTG